MMFDNKIRMKTEIYPATETSKKDVWSVILKVIIAIATAIAGTIGIQACQLF